MILSGLLSLILSSVALAQVPPICSNLSAVTCTEGVRNDGTGESTVTDSSAFIINEFVRLEPSIRQTFDQMLKTPEGAKLKSQTAKACRLDVTDCKNLQSPSCEAKALTCLSRLFIITEMDPQLGMLYNNIEHATFFDAEQSLKLVQNPTYVKAAQSVAYNNSVSISQDLKDKVEKSIFPDVQLLLRKKIKELPIDESTRALLDQKIATAKFAGVQCRSPEERKTEVDYSTRLNESLYPQAHYDVNTHSFMICPAYLRYTSSEFDLASLIAHELSHSIDPCALGGDDKRAMSEAKPDQVIEDRYLRPGFLRCLRGRDSIGARSFRPVNPPVADADQMIQNDLKRLCYDDQINESVADWFAAEALASYIPLRNSKIKPPLTTKQVQTGMSNIYRAFCSDDYNNPNSQGSHPPARDRLNSIFLVQPQLREMMGCPAGGATKRYCDINNPSGLTNKPTAKSRSNKKVKQ